MCEISIIIPVYNKKSYIADSVQSVLRQTFRDFELLLIDDGSTDGSGLICDRLSAMDARVKVFHTDNHGVSAARNRGIKEASGKYIGFIDADDYIDKTFLQKLHTSITENDVELVTCGYYEIRNGKKTVHDIKNYNSGDEVFEYLRQDLLCILWNKLFVREKIKHLFDESISTCEDSIFCSRYYYDNHPKIALINQALYGYVAHNSGLTSNFQEKSFDGINKLLVINNKIIKLINDKRLRNLARHHIYKVYYYGIYTYIFENLSKSRLNKQQISLIGLIINDEKYQRIIRYIVSYSKTDRKAERIGVGEYLIILFSLLKMKRTVLFISKLRRRWNKWILMKKTGIR